MTLTRMPKWIIAALFPAVLAASPSALRAQEKMTLQEFIDTAVRNSAAVRISGESVAGAADAVKVAKSATFPQVSLSGTYTRLSLTQEFDIPDLGHFKFSSPDTYGFSLGATEQVFTWGRVKKTIALSRIGQDIAQGGVTLTSQMLSYQIVPIFYGVLFTNEAVKVIDSTLAGLHGKLAILEERFRAGLVSDFDISLLKVQISGLESQKVDYLNTVNDMIMTYNRIAGRPLASTFVPDAALDFEPAVPDAAALLAEAVANRPEARLVRSQRELALTQVSLTRTADKPNVIASFNYNVRNGYLPAVTALRNYWTATVGVSYPVFDGGRTRAQAAQALVAVRTVDEQTADMMKGFELEIAQYIADLKSIEDKIGIERARIDHAEKALKIADERYRNGLLSMTDLVDAQNSLDSARLNYLQLVYNHILGRFNLSKAAGRKIYS
jgi:outer membrane protein